MREAHAAPDGLTRPSPLVVLARVASAVHGASPVEDKLVWVAEALRSLTDAQLAAYVDIQPGPDRAVSAAGVSAFEVKSFAAPALRRAAGGATSVPLTGSTLAGERRWHLFLQRVGLPPSPGFLGTEVRSEEGVLQGLLFACHPDAEHFHAGDQATADALAAHLGVALGNGVRLVQLTELQEV